MDAVRGLIFPLPKFRYHKDSLRPSRIRGKQWNGICFSYEVDVTEEDLAYFAREDVTSQEVQEHLSFITTDAKRQAADKEEKPEPIIAIFFFIFLVRTRRLELPQSYRLLGPQPNASTNSATCACLIIFFKVLGCQPIFIFESCYKVT